jgi:hypothetical protein
MKIPVILLNYPTFERVYVIHIFMGTTNKKFASNQVYFIRVSKFRTGYLDWLYVACNAGDGKTYCRVSTIGIQDYIL